MTYRYRYEFEALDDRGRRRVRAYRGDVCVMSGVLDAQSVTVTPPRVDMWCPCHESEKKVFERYPEERIDDGQRAIDALIAGLSKSIVCVFVDNFPWSLEAVRTFATEPEADAYMLGVRDVTDEVIAAQWPFTAESLVLRGVHRLNAPALIDDARTRIAEMGLVTT